MHPSLSLLSDIVNSEHANSRISVLYFPSKAELSQERVKLKQAALDNLHGSTSEDPGIAKLETLTEQLDEWIETSESYDTQPSEGITTFKQAHELRADRADATNLA